MKKIINCVQKPMFDKQSFLKEKEKDKLVRSFSYKLNFAVVSSANMPRMFSEMALVSKIFVNGDRFDE